jgi:hypothetical protein
MWSRTANQFGYIDGCRRAVFGRSRAAEPDVLIEQLKGDEAVAEADTLLLIVPNQLGGASFIAESFLVVLAPQYDLPYVIVPMFLALASLMLWLLIKGVDRAQWDAMQTARHGAALKGCALGLRSLDWCEIAKYLFDPFWAGNTPRPDVVN